MRFWGVRLAVRKFGKMVVKGERASIERFSRVTRLHAMQPKLPQKVTEAEQTSHTAEAPLGGSTQKSEIQRARLRVDFLQMSGDMSES